MVSWQIRLEISKREKTGKGLRFIDDSHHIQASNSTSILGGLALSIIEVGRDSDHSMCNLQNGGEEKGKKKKKEGGWLLLYVGWIKYIFF